MKKILKIFAFIMAMILFVSFETFLPSGAASNSELQNKIDELEQRSEEIESDIEDLKDQIDKQNELKEAIEQKIAVIQEQIIACNNEISNINAKIDANQKEIDQKNAEIEENELAFKKRLRAIYMSNTGSNIQILLGAEDFSQLLQLSQLTASVSARDKLLIEKIVEAIDALEDKMEENNKLLEQQLSVKNIIVEKQKELEAENNQITSVINKIESDKNSLDSDKADIEKQIADYEAEMRANASPSGPTIIYDGGQFLWPVSGFYRISAPFKSNDSVHRGDHDGIDIAGGGISGQPILAIADGTVTRANNSCKHNYGKSGSCGCGGGFGNYVTINHGRGSDGSVYVATYGHMSKTAVGVGASVKKGQVIGYVGSTGWSTGYHLHLGISMNGRYVDPMRFDSSVK